MAKEVAIHGWRPARGRGRDWSVAHPSLGRILDPQALDDEHGHRGRLRITVPAAWTNAPCELELVVPLRLPCARCDGGGCDGCGRSGAVKAPRGEAERTLSARLPKGIEEGVALRIAQPFGAEGEIVQLFVEVRVGAAASPGVRRIEPPPPLSPPRVGRPVAIALSVALSLATLAALLAGLFGR